LLFEAISMAQLQPTMHARAAAVVPHYHLLLLLLLLLLQPSG
jgi:hypothetical protein